MNLLIKYLPSLMKVALISLPFLALNSNSQLRAKESYLSFVQKFADTLLMYGTDKYGTRHLPMWAGLIDTRNYAVPMGTAEEADRTKMGEGYFDVFDRRAVGGANIYHDLESLHVFEVLSMITKNPKYKKAAEDYMIAFLNYTQSEHTGLLGWGEHMYYDFYTDKVNVGGNTIDSDLTHELLPKKPIWDKLWNLDTMRTAKAIKGLRYHFEGPYTQTYLFNRHASWQKINKSINGYEDTDIQQYAYNWSAPFIAHAGLFAYSFMFLHSKTNEKEWLKWSEGVGNLHWNYRDTSTNLTSWDINPRRPTGPQFGQTVQFAYRLYQAYELKKTEEHMRSKALVLFKAAEHYAWQENEKFYINELNSDGSAVKSDDSRFNRAARAPGDRVKTLRLRPVFTGNIGRAALYFYAREKDPYFLQIAKRMAHIMNIDTLNVKFRAADVAVRIHFLMDMYEATGEKKFVSQAKTYANIGVNGLWRNGLFARRVSDPYYESLSGVGNFAGSLLRVHLATAKGFGEIGKIDWSY